MQNQQNQNPKQELNLQEVFDGLVKLNHIQKELLDISETFNKFGTLLNYLIQQGQQGQQPAQGQQQSKYPTTPTMIPNPNLGQN